MKLLKKLSPAPIHPIQMGLFILIELQLLFGKQFTTFHIVGPLHLSDLVFSLIAVAALLKILFRYTKIPVNIPIFTLLAISLVYLVYSIVTSIGPLNYIIRHYALFVYMGLSFIIFYSYINEERAGLNIRFLVLIGFLALIAQVLTHIYNFIFLEEYHTRLFSEFNYLTELIMPGLVIFEIWILFFVEKRWLKITGMAAVIILTTTLGHASAFLAAFVPLILYFFLKIRLRPVFLIVGTLGALVILFLLVPQFSDVNAMWRILYWREILKEGVLNYYGIFGHGFGGAFITENMNQAFLAELGSIHFDVNPEEKYLTPMHNSFVTIMFHIGIIPGLLIILPLLNAFKWAFSYKDSDKRRMFLFLSLVGFSVWASFNVILEMPHSSAFYWLVYFSVVYEFGNKDEKTFSVTLSKRNNGAVK